MSTTWYIDRLCRNLSDGLVVTAYWRCTAVDGDSSVSTSGSVGFERGESFTPYEELTEEQVLGWVKSQLDVSNIEYGLQSHIEAKKTPVIGEGVPW